MKQKIFKGHKQTMTKTRSFLCVFMREAFIEQTLNQVAL